MFYRDPNFFKLTFLILSALAQHKNNTFLRTLFVSNISYSTAFIRSSGLHLLVSSSISIFKVAYDTQLSARLYNKKVSVPEQIQDFQNRTALPLRIALSRKRWFSLHARADLVETKVPHATVVDRAAALAIEFVGRIVQFTSKN